MCVLREAGAFCVFILYGGDVGGCVFLTVEVVSLWVVLSLVMLVSVFDFLWFGGLGRWGALEPYFRRLCCGSGVVVFWCVWYLILFFEACAFWGFVLWVRCVTFIFVLWGCSSLLGCL